MKRQKLKRNFSSITLTFVEFDDSSEYRMRNYDIRSYDLRSDARPGPILAIGIFSDTIAQP